MERVNIKQDDEIGDLGEAFNYMADQIEKQEKLRRDFVADVSHELRSPLSNVQGFIEAMLDGKDKTAEDRTRYLGILHKETLRLTRLVNELLDLSRLEAGIMPIDKRPVEIVEIIGNTIEKARSIVKEKEVDIVLNVHPDSDGNSQFVVLCNRDRIEQVVTNLLDNAARYSPRGNTIRVNVAKRSDRLEVTVVDQGEGISPQDLPKIWERFYKVDKARSREVAGTGLGLAIVRQIIESLDGEVRVRSEPGQGTEIGFLLPIYYGG